MPEWIRQQLGNGPDYGRTHKAVQTNKLHTVCQEARCPNRGECWSRGTATFMLLGDTCTRACGFCSVKTGRPGLLNNGEPEQVTEAIKAMDLHYVVLTSVNRDDLVEGGASIFARTYTLLKEYRRDMGIEFLTPDFQQNQKLATDIIMEAVRPYANGDKPALVWGHNIETVPRLYRVARKGSRYQRSLDLLKMAADLRQAGVSRIAIGQYLRPTAQHLPVESYIHPTEFAALQQQAQAIGFSWVKAGAMVRSSYHADDE
jgi:lipoic acid synthetase